MEEVAPPRKRNEVRPKPPKVIAEDDRPPPRAKPKAKASSRASQEPESRKEKSKDKSSSSRDGAREKPPSSSKPSSSATGKKAGPSKFAKETIVEEAGEDAEPKKKRKIFLPATQPMTFDWNVPQQEGGLDIPTALSPIKGEARPMPEKSLLSKVSKGLFGFG